MGLCGSSLPKFCDDIIRERCIKQGRLGKGVTQADLDLATYQTAVADYRRAISNYVVGWDNLDDEARLGNNRHKLLAPFGELVDACDNTLADAGRQVVTQVAEKRRHYMAIADDNEDLPTYAQATGSGLDGKYLSEVKRANKEEQRLRTQWSFICIPLDEVVPQLADRTTAKSAIPIPRSCN